ncbi:MAG: DUF898 domain-containing protein [Comamonadaceae bacterium]|nr:MAG: DUF898 domain-containing protein [Comamonadaceae bacterium]
MLQCAPTQCTGDGRMELIQKTSHVLAPPSVGMHEYPVHFTASGSEYFRIWIVNLLLIVVTLGIYLPWAKVRKLKYFYSNTVVDGHALDFHGKASQMLLGLFVVWICLAAYSIATDLSGVAGMAAALVFVAVWPNLFRSAMRFRLANTSWRGLRMRFTGDLAGARKAIAPPLALGLLPFALLGIFIDKKGGGSIVAQGLVATLAFGMLLALVVALPYFLWRVRSYQHGNYGWGPLRTQFRSGAKPFYTVMLKTSGVALLGLICFGVAGFVWRRESGFGLAALLGFIPLMLAFLFFVNVVPRAYLMSQMQNLVWSRTGNSQFRFRSELAFGPYALLQFRNYVLILLTLGLFWPFAVVANRRAQLEAVTLYSYIDLKSLDAVAAEGADGAAGDAAADMFGLDIGM